ncbi:MAG: cobalamin-binding protein [Bacillota bacterium]
MRKTFVGLVLVVMLVASLSGCNWFSQTSATPTPAPAPPPSPWPLAVTDRSGQQVTIAAQPGRIISMAPNLTEILFALNLGSKVVGRTSFCNHPPEAAAIPSVGDEWSPNYELIAGLKPDLVLAVGTAESKIVVESRRLGLTTVVTQSATIEEVFEDIVLVGKVAGATQAAEQLVDTLRGRYHAIKEKTRDAKDRPSVFWVIDIDLWTVGPGTFMDHLTTVAGGVNVAASEGFAYLQYSMEALLAKDPDVIIVAVPKDEYPKLQAKPGWDQLSAVKNQRVLFPDPDVVSRPGPRIVDGLELVARGLHPQLFR